jgi:hypothetical protein
MSDAHEDFLDGLHVVAYELQRVIGELDGMQDRLGISALPFSQECDATRDCNDYVCVQDVRYLIPPERWPELERLYMLEVHDCGHCGGEGKYQRSNTRCVSCGGSGKQIIAGGVR